MEKTPGKRIEELDALRGVAALAVVASHYGGKFDKFHNLVGSSSLIFLYGYYGVYLFFVISGFVIYMTLHRCRTGLDFVVSRFSRIFPAYWAALLITFAVLHLPGSTDQPTVLRLLLSFTMLERFFGFEHLDTVYWTLNVELSFYLWMFLVFKLGWLDRIEEIIPFILLFQATVETFAWGLGHPFSQGANVVFLLEYAHLFCAGMLFYRAWHQGFTPRIVLLLGWCMVNQTIVRYREFAWMPSDTVNDVATACILVFMALTVKGWTRWLTHPLLLYFGTISYTLYLLHRAVGIAIMDNLAALGMAHGLRALIAFLALVLLSSLLTFLVEKPAMAWIRRSYRQFKMVRNPSTGPG